MVNFTGNNTGFHVTFHFLAQKIHLQYRHKTPRIKLKQFLQLVDEIYLTKMTLFYVCTYLHFNISITTKVYEHSQVCNNHVHSHDGTGTERYMDASKISKRGGVWVLV